MLFEFTLNGFSFQYLWPNSIWWANNCLPFFICTALLWGYIFIFTHINLKKKFPLIRKIIISVIIIPCETWAILSLFFKYRISIVGATALTILSSTIAFSTVLYTMIKNDRASRYILIGSKDNEIFYEKISFASDVYFPHIAYHDIGCWKMDTNIIVKKIKLYEFKKNNNNFEEYIEYTNRFNLVKYHRI